MQFTRDVSFMRHVYLGHKHVHLPLPDEEMHARLGNFLTPKGQNGILTLLFQF